MRKGKRYIDKLKEFCAIFKDITGDIIEIGVYDGDDSEIICSYLQDTKSDKKYIGIDTFEGYVEEDLADANEHAKANHTSNRWQTSAEVVHKRLSRFDNYKIYKGDCKSLVPELIDSKDIGNLSIVYIDCNLYIPSIKSMHDLYPLLSVGGAIAIDEHLVGGETKAIKQMAREIDSHLIYFSDVGPSYYLVKK